MTMSDGANEPKPATFHEDVPAPEPEPEPGTFHEDVPEPGTFHE